MSKTDKRVLKILRISVLSLVLGLWGPGLLAQSTNEPPPDLTGLSPLETETEAKPPADVMPASFEVKISSEQDSGEEHPIVGESFLHKIIVSWKGQDTALDVELPEYDSFENLTLEKVSSISRMETKDGEPLSEIVYLFNLKPVAEGHATIPEIRVDYHIRGDDTLRTLRAPAVELEVAAAPSRGLSWRDVILILGVTVVAVAILAGLLLLFLMRRKPAEEPEPTFNERFSEEIQKVRQSILSGDQPAFCATAARVVRAALEEGGALTAERRETAESFASRCEEGKYAPRSFTREELDRQQKTFNEILTWLEP